MSGISIGSCMERACVPALKSGLRKLLPEFEH